MSQDIFVVIEHWREQVADISYVLLAAGRVLAQGCGGQVIAVLLGRNVSKLGSDPIAGSGQYLAADQVWYIDHPALADFTSEAYQRVLVNLISENLPWVVLFGDTSIGGDVAGWLSARLSLPLISYCRSVWAEDGRLKFVSQICGGKIMAEGDLPGPTVLVMMIPGSFKPEQGQCPQPPEVIRLAAPALEEGRIKVTDYIEPASGDVDISKEPILIAVGRGFQNQADLELAEALAEALGGAVCASRPMVDQGWLAATRLVGKSGKKVKPQLYLTLGISGAPEHVEAITDSQLVIAVNTNPAAPIFDVAHYGAAVDMYDLLPALTEQVRQIRSG